MKATAGRMIARHRGLIVGFVAQTMQYGAALALVPFMVTRLTPAEVGLWYIFMGVQALAFVCDFGFQPSFARAIALGLSGARALEARGLGERPDETQGPNHRLVADTVAAARLFYRLLALAVLALLLAFGLPYVTAVAARNGLTTGSVQLSWIIFSLAVSLNLAWLWITPVLMGSERIEQNYLFIIANRATSATLGIAVLLSGGGLVALAVTLVAGQAVARIVAVAFLRPLQRDLSAYPPERASTHGVLRTIWPNAGRMGLVAIGTFLILRYNLFAISTFNGLAVAGVYALSLQMLTAVGGVAQLPMQIALPRLIGARMRKERATLRHLFLGAMGLFVIVFLAGASFVVLVTPPLLTAIGSRISILPSGTLTLLAGVMMLEGLHANAGFFITTGNDVPFVRAAILSGIAIAATTTVAGWMGLGVTAMIACQGLVQLSYNNWRWPLLAWREIVRT